MNLGPWVIAVWLLDGTVRNWLLGLSSGSLVMGTDAFSPLSGCGLALSGKSPGATSVGSCCGASLARLASRSGTD